MASKDRGDLVKRGTYKSNLPGIVTFVGLRAADPFLQYNILKNDWGSSLVSRLGGTILPKGPPLITNTPFDHVGLSPYRSIVLGMSIGCMLKQNYNLLFHTREEMTPFASALVGVFNTVLNSASSLLFICSQTSASVNGEHFPQTPLIVGASLYVSGLFIEWFSEVQRAAFKKKPENKGKIYEGGLFSLSRHVNYFGYTLWRAGYALAAGGWIWGATVGAFFAYDFTQRAIPTLHDYLSQRYGEQYTHYEQAVPYKFVPFVY